MPSGLPIFFRFIFGIFGVIGLTIIISMWSAPFNEFGSPPLFFRIFASLIGLAFIAFGFGVAFSKSGNHPGATLSKFSQTLRQTGSPKKYKCPHCSGGIENQEVSTSGDVKCEYCGKWYNVHT
jgi:hypothetical protein